MYTMYIQMILHMSLLYTCVHVSTRERYRFGTTLYIDTHGNTPTHVDNLRQGALVNGNYKYRNKETLIYSSSDKRYACKSLDYQVLLTSLVE